MKYQKLFVIVVSVCLMAFFNVLSFAQTPQAKSDSAKARDTVAKALEASGLTVVADEYNPSSMEFFTADDFVGLTFKEDGIDVTVNGKPVSGELKLDDNRPGEWDEVSKAIGEPRINLLECIQFATQIWAKQLQICQIETGELIDFLCVPQAYYNLNSNILRCVKKVGEGSL